MTAPSDSALASLTPDLRLRRLAAAVLLAVGLAGCGSFEQPPTTFDLSVPEGAKQASPGGRLLVVAEPVALQALESDRIVVRAADGTVSFLPGVQWADRLPRLLQARMVQSFENTGRSVGRASNGLSADVALTSDIRFFGVRTDGGGQAVVELSAKLVSADGRIERARVFRAATPLASVEGKAAAAALDQSMTKVLAELVRWAGRG